MYNPFNSAEQNAVMHYVFLIADADVDLNQSERALITLLGKKFGMSQMSLTNAVCMSDSTANATLSSMTEEKKHLAAALFIGAAMANGSMKAFRPEMDKCYEVLKKCNLPGDVKFTDANYITHRFVEE